MKSRCYNRRDSRFPRYGGRGINICQEWLNSFENFYEWSMKNSFHPGLAIDREDNDGDYEPDNCQWITRMQNWMKSCHPEIPFLSDEQVIEIRGKYSDLSTEDIAALFRISYNSAYNVRIGRTYRHLPLPIPKKRVQFYVSEISE